MAGQNYRDDWTGSYGRLPRRGVPAPDREMPGDFISPYLRSLFQSKQTSQEPEMNWIDRLNAAAEQGRLKREANRAAQPPDTRPGLVEGVRGNLAQTGQQLRDIGNVVGGYTSSANQPGGERPEYQVNRNPTPYDPNSDWLSGKMNQVGGALKNAWQSMNQPPTIPSRAAGPSQNRPQGNAPVGYGAPHPGYVESKPADKFTNGTQRVLQSIGAKPEDDFSVSEEDDDSVTLSPAQKNERNEARLADARAAGIPDVVYGPEIPGGKPISKTQPTAKNQPAARTQAYGSPSSGFRNQGPILAPLGTGSNQPKLATPPIETNAQRFGFTNPLNVPEPGVNEAEAHKNDQFLGPQEDEEQFAIEPTSAALDRYLAHLEAMPEQRQPRWFDRVAAGLIGAGEGARSGAGAGFQAGQSYLNAPYNQEVAQWATKGKGLQEAASLEGSSMNNYMKNLKMQSQMGEAESRNEARRQAGLQRDFSNKTGRMNAETRMAGLALRRDEFNAEEDTMPDPKTGTVVAINRRTGARRDTGIQSIAYKRYLQQQIMQDRQIQHLSAQERRALAAEAQRWSSIQETTRANNLRLGPIEE